MKSNFIDLPGGHVTEADPATTLNPPAALAAPKILPIGMLMRFRDATAAAYQAQRNPQLLWRLAELNRALGDLPAAAAAFAEFALGADDGEKAQSLSQLMAGTGSSKFANADGVIPFVLVSDFAPEAELVKIRKEIEDRRDAFAVAMVGQNDKRRVDVNSRSAFFIRADDSFRDMTRDFFWKQIDRHNVLLQLGLGPISETKDEVEAIAYGSGGKYAVHRDNAPSVDNGRVLTVVWFVHDDPKGFEGGDLLLHDEPPAGQGFTRIVPMRNSAVFFPSDCLHEVTPVDSKVEDVLQSRMVLNGWFHRA